MKKVIHCRFFCSFFQKAIWFYLLSPNTFSLVFILNSHHFIRLSLFRITVQYYTILCIGFYIAEISFGVRHRINDRAVAMLFNPIRSMLDFNKTYCPYLQFNLRSKEHKLFPSLPGDIHSVHQVLYWTLNVILKFVEFFFVYCLFPYLVLLYRMCLNLLTWTISIVDALSDIKTKSFEFFFSFEHNSKEYLYDEKSLFEIFFTHKRRPNKHWLWLKSLKFVYKVPFSKWMKKKMR